MPLTVVSLSYLPVAFGLGTLHALEPGHAKTMTAAYLVGISGRWTDAVLLGLSAALTHSLVVILIAISDRLLRKNTVVRSPVGGKARPTFDASWRKENLPSGELHNCGHKTSQLKA